MKAMNIGAEVKFRVARSIMDSPVARLYMRERTVYHHTRYIPRCDVVVDGFPRSANTYVWFALKRTVEPKHFVRGHTHSAETLAAAVRDRKPAMLLLRDPDSSVASLYQMLDGVSLGACFDAYSRFHEKCLRLIPGMYVAGFEDVVSDLGAVIDDFYTAFDLDWPRYVKTAESERVVFDIIDHSNQRKYNGQISEAGVARPSSQRRPASKVISGLSQKQESSRERAWESYRALRRHQRLDLS